MENLEKQIVRIIENNSPELAAIEILRLFAVSVQCEHPYDSILKGNDIRPTQCLKCGKALSGHCH